MSLFCLLLVIWPLILQKKLACVGTLLKNTLSLRLSLDHSKERRTLEHMRIHSCSSITSTKYGRTDARIAVTLKRRQNRLTFDRQLLCLEKNRPQKCFYCVWSNSFYWFFLSEYSVHFGVSMGRKFFLLLLLVLLVRIVLFKMN